MTIKIPEKLHFSANLNNDQWVVTCLDFNLAAQDDTFEGAKTRVEEQIESYFETINSLDNAKDRKRLLRRRAPIIDWVRYYLAKLLLLLDK